MTVRYVLGQSEKDSHMKAAHYNNYYNSIMVIILHILNNEHYCPYMDKEHG